MLSNIKWKSGEKDMVKMFLNSGGELCGITEQLIFEYRQKSTDLHTALWSICEEFLLENIKSKNFENIKTLYLEMESILILQKKSPNQIVKKRLYYDLLNMKQQNSLIVIIVSSYDSCDACKKLDGQEYDIDDAIQKQPLPPKNCICLRCNCIY